VLFVGLVTFAQFSSPLMLGPWAVTVADDPILVLGPALAEHLRASPNWAGWFIAALGAGTVLGSMRRSRHEPTLRLAATSLAALALCMITGADFDCAPGRLGTPGHACERTFQLRMLVRWRE
jgi:hypothetical protein